MMMGLSLSVCAPRSGGLEGAIRSLFAAGEQGVWYDPSDFTTMWQDSAGTTPVTATGQPDGKINDKSGRGNHASQATAGSRPLLQQATAYGMRFDGVDDGLATNTGMVFPATADLFVLIRRNSTAAGLVLTSTTTASYAFIFDSADAVGHCHESSLEGPSAKTFVNGIQLTGGNVVTRATLHTAMPNGQWVVAEAQNLLFVNADWTSLRLGNYTALFLNADVGGFILCPSKSDATRAQIRAYLGAKAGLSL